MPCCSGVLRGNAASSLSAAKQPVPREATRRLRRNVFMDTAGSFNGGRSRRSQGLEEGDESPLVIGRQLLEALRRALALAAVQADRLIQRGGAAVVQVGRRVGHAPQ